MADTENSTIFSSRVTDYGPAVSTALVRLHSLGDVVLAQPAAARLAELGPVTLVTSREYGPVVARMEGVATALHERCSGVSGLRRLLMEVSPDRTVDLQNSLTTRLATMGMRVSGRFRMDRGIRKRVLRGAGDTMPSRRSDFLRAAGFDEGGRPVLERSCCSPPGRLSVGLVAGGRWYLKSIPSGVLAEAARLLIDLYGADIVITGGPEEAELVSRIATSVMRDGVATYTGQNGIEGLIRVLEGLSLLISPDSGPAHLAMALGVPALVVFTSTSPVLGFWEPGDNGLFMTEDLVCRPCHRHGGKTCARGAEACRKGIVPLDVVRRAMGMVDR